ncbi:hypothetical protein [Actinopolymorpha alba]|uniref:hypothetical protein n=1 Tax=Actinopolymorpha alba TaxID=533267 RepID=UPI000367A7FA|nr:hypothetical protein [Actinopolymorpha alba]
MRRYDGTDAESEVAELADTPRRSIPRWLRLGALACVAVVTGLLLFQRLTEPAVRAEVAPPRFVDNYTVELDVSISNQSGEPQVVKVDPPRIAGFDTALTVFKGSGQGDGSVVLAAHRRTTYTLAWRVRDCAATPAAGPGDVAARVTFGRTVGVRETLRLDLGEPRKLVPSICQLTPDRGQPRLVDTGHVRWTRGRPLAITITVQNTGGRPLTYRGAVLPSGATAGDAGPTLRPAPTVPVGGQQEITLWFEANGCRMPVGGPSTVVLRFTTAGSNRPDSLEVRLADSWENLLGVCDPDF